MINLQDYFNACNAIYDNDIESLKSLLAKNHQLTAITFNDDQLLHHAARFNFPEAIKEILDKGANIEARGTFGMTPLMILLEANGSSDEDIKESFFTLINKGANINATAGDTEDSVAHSAAISGNTEIMDYLINQGINPFIENNIGEGLLHMAALYNQPEMIQYLLNKGLEANKANVTGHTPVMHLIGDNDYPEENILPGLKLLAENGADLNASFVIDDMEDRNMADGDLMISSGKVAHLAAFHGNPQVMDYLAKQGVDLSVTNQEGQGLLEVANMYNKSEMVDYLLDKHLSNDQAMNQETTHYQLVEETPAIDVDTHYIEDII